MANNKETCKDCRHFLQHYTFADGSFDWVYCGHCTKPRVKNKKPDDDICKHFELRDQNDIPDLSKQYLTRRLLEYVLGLYIPPDTYNKV